MHTRSIVGDYTIRRTQNRAVSVEVYNTQLSSTPTIITTLFMRIYFFTTRIMSLIEIQKLIEQLPEPQKDLVSDGYHSFKELYDHRIKLFVALCNVLENWDTEIGHPSQCWKSKLHSDGTMFDGWFIAGIGTEP